MKIRKETPRDFAQISSVVSEAFEPMPFSKGQEAQIVERLRESGALTISLVATTSNRVVGHIAFSPITIDGATGPWFQLSPVSVAPAFQGQGIGTMLIRTGLEHLSRRQARVCVLLGNPDFYGRFGFESSHDLSDQYPRHNPFFLSRELGDERHKGRVALHPAFHS